MTDYYEIPKYRLGGLANGAARASTAVQAVPEGTGIAIQAQVAVGAGMGATSAVQLFLSTSIDGVNWLGSGVDGGDKLVTVPAATSLIYLGTVLTPTSGVVVVSPEFELRTRKPLWWSVVVLNSTGAALRAIGNRVLWRPVG